MLRAIRNVERPARPHRLLHHLAVHLVLELQCALPHQDHLRVVNHVQRRRRRRRPWVLHRLVQLHRLARRQRAMQHLPPLPIVRRSRRRHRVHGNRPRRAQRSPARHRPRLVVRRNRPARRLLTLRRRKLRCMHLTLHHARAQYSEGRKTNTNIPAAHIFHARYPTSLPPPLAPSIPKIGRHSDSQSQNLRICFRPFGICFRPFGCHSRRESALSSAVILTRRVRISVFAFALLVFAFALLVVIPEGNLLCLRPS